MMETIKVIINHDGEDYTAEGVELNFYTQKKTVSEVFENIRKALSVHLDSETRDEYVLVPVCAAEH